jgi:hypothetical protein
MYVFMYISMLTLTQSIRRKSVKDEDFKYSSIYVGLTYFSLSA